MDESALARSILGGQGDASEAAVEPWQQRKQDKRGKKWESSGRPRPGAALAMAKREQVGIVPGQGQKISFD